MEKVKVRKKRKRSNLNKSRVILNKKKREDSFLLERIFGALFFICLMIFVVIILPVSNDSRKYKDIYSSVSTEMEDGAVDLVTFLNNTVLKDGYYVSTKNYKIYKSSTGLMVSNTPINDVINSDYLVEEDSFIPYKDLFDKEFIKGIINNNKYYDKVAKYQVDGGETASIYKLRGGDDLVKLKSNLLNLDDYGSGKLTKTFDIKNSKYVINKNRIEKNYNSQYSGKKMDNSDKTFDSVYLDNILSNINSFTNNDNGEYSVILIDLYNKDNENKFISKLNNEDSELIVIEQDDLYGYKIAFEDDKDTFMWINNVNN